MKKDEIPKKISLKEKWRNWMNLIQEKTGIKGIYVVIGLIISVVLVYFNIFDSVITNLVGTLYPAFWTIKSIEKDDLPSQKHWLIYWAVFGFFVLIDMFSPIIAKFIPFYLVLKILFLIWMFMPGTNGHRIFYEFVVKRIFRKYEEDIDDAIGVLQNQEDRNRQNLYRRINSRNNNIEEVYQSTLQLSRSGTNIIEETEDKKEKEKEKKE